MKKLLGSYLKQNAKSIIMYIVFFIICSVVFYLNGIPLDVVLYAFELCSVIGGVVFLIDFYLYQKKHKILAVLLKEIEVTIEHMPVAADMIEKDYQQVIETLFKLKKSIDLENVLVRKDMLDYYTMWAHQIKTPIAAISILLQSQEIIDVKALQVELFKIEQYVEMVLSYLRLDSMNSDLQLEKISLDEVVKSAIRKYSSIFIAKKLKLIFTETNTFVLTDKKWISFVIEQILSNAVKYTSDGSISIYIEGEDVLVIEDTGIGIQEEDLPRVFERGFTGYNGRNYNKSTGLGLYLCKTIIDKLSHEIVIQSKLAEGTKVKIDFSKNEIIIE